MVQQQEFTDQNIFAPVKPEPEPLLSNPFYILELLSGIYHSNPFNTLLFKNENSQCTCPKFPPQSHTHITE